MPSVLTSASLKRMPWCASSSDFRMRVCLPCQSNLPRPTGEKL